MSKEKQLEEMAEYIFGNAITHDTKFKEDCRSIAIDLYNAGYRKQSEGEWIVEEDENGYDVYRCSKCHRENASTRNYCPECGVHMKGGAE